MADEATLPIYYESRIAKLALNAAELPKPDAEFKEITEGEELTKIHPPRRNPAAGGGPENFLARNGLSGNTYFAV